MSNRSRGSLTRGTNLFSSFSRGFLKNNTKILFDDVLKRNGIPENKWPIINLRCLLCSPLTVVFVCMKLLLKHLKLCHTNKHFQELLDGPFFNRDMQNAQFYVDRHILGRSFQCVLCDSKTRSIDDYTNHMIIHGGIFPGTTHFSR